MSQLPALRMPGTDEFLDFDQWFDAVNLPGIRMSLSHFRNEHWDQDSAEEGQRVKSAAYTLMHAIDEFSNEMRVALFRN